MKQNRTKSKNKSTNLIREISTQLANALETPIYVSFDEIICTTLKEKYSSDDNGRLGYISDSKAKLALSFERVLRDSEKDKSYLFESFKYLLDVDEISAQYAQSSEKEVDPTEAATALRHLLIVGVGRQVTDALLHGCVPKSETELALKEAACRALELMQFWHRLNNEFLLLDRAPMAAMEEIRNNPIFKNLKQSFTKDVKRQMKKDGLNKQSTEHIAAKMCEVADEIFSAVTCIGTLQKEEEQPTTELNEWDENSNFQSEIATRSETKPVVH